MKLGKKIETPKIHYFAGIDPGKNGGIAVLTSGEKKDSSGVVKSYPSRLEVFPMPKTLQGIYDTIKYGVASRFTVHPGYIYLEKVGGYMPGKEGNIGSRMFTFGENYGAIKMALVASGLSSCYKVIQPSVWIPEVGIALRKKHFDTAGGNGELGWKRHLKRRAQELFPDTKVTLKTADALLLAYYCWLKKS